jgi:hypothetical protein
MKLEGRHSLGASPFFCFDRVIRGARGYVRLFVHNGNPRVLR